MPKITLALMILTISCGLFGANLLEYNITKNDLKQSVDIYLILDAPYTASIQKMNQKDKTLLKLQDINFNKTIQEYINLKNIKNIILKPLNGSLYVIIESSNILNIAAIDTNNKNKIKIEINTKDVTTSNNTPQLANGELKKNYVNNNFINIIKVFLFIVLIVFIYLAILYFKKSRTYKKKKITIVSSPTISFSKKIYKNNQIVLISFCDINYLVLLGSSNLLLAKFDKDMNKIEEYKYAKNYSDKENLNSFDKYKHKAQTDSNINNLEH